MEMLSKDESYAERRQLFKNIWETAMHIDEKEADTIKPKVIKTLRLDDVDKYVIGKSKKEKLKNLRAICNKILDFCDRQENDLLYQQIITEPGVITAHFKPKKLKTHRKRKIKRRKTLFTTFHTDTIANKTIPTTSEVKESATNVKISKEPQSFEINNMPTIGRALVSNYMPISDPEDINKENCPGKTITTRRKVRKKRSKRKKLSEPIMHLSKGTPNHVNTVNATVRGRAVLRRVKQVLAVNKIIISKPTTQQENIQINNII